MFDRNIYLDELRTSWLGVRFLYKQEIESTNTFLKRVPPPEFGHGIVLLADLQKKGRGQYDRKWHSQPGENLTFTIGLKPSEAGSLTLLTLSVAEAMAVVIQEQLDVEVLIKWPNDLIVSGCKVGGILTESVFNGSDLERVLIGIGVNVNQQDFHSGLDSVTSLALEIGRPVDREELLCRILEGAEQAYINWQNREREWIAAINRRLIGFGEWTHLQVNGELLDGRFKVLGVNENGYLVTLTSDYAVNTFSYEQIRIIPDHTASRLTS